MFSVEIAARDAVAYSANIMPNPPHDGAVSSTYIHVDNDCPQASSPKLINFGGSNFDLHQIL